MKVFEIIWTEFAEWNLEQVYEYAISKSFSKATAHKTVKGIILRVEQLELYPKSGQIEPQLSGHKKQFRYLVYKNYKIIYFIENHKVYITDVFHCKISPKKMKKRNT